MEGGGGDSGESLERDCEYGLLLYMNCYDCTDKDQPQSNGTSCTLGMNPTFCRMCTHRKVPLKWLLGSRARIHRKTKSHLEVKHDQR